MLKKLVLGMEAGILIALGGGVFLACSNKIVGACLFSVALVCICYLGYSLFTGKICYVVDNLNKDYMGVILFGILGNLIATIVCGLALRYALPSIGETAETICNAKLTQTWWQTIIRGIFCGLCIYLSVEIFKKKGTTIGILLCIPTFIISGYEHSIADMFYFGASGIFSLKAVGFILLVIVGNSIGGVLLPLLSKVVEKNNEKK